MNPDMTAAARYVLQAAAMEPANGPGAVALWQRLTGLEYAPAMQYAQQLAFGDEP